MRELLPRAQQHLRRIAAAPRPAGGPADDAARAHAAEALAAAGFEVRETPFEYSTFPGRYGTPLVGGAGILAVATASHFAARGGAAVGLAILVGAAVLLGVAGRWLARDGVLDLQFMRTTGRNLVATRGAAMPRVWLMAHTDSKSQPVPQALRAAGVIGLGATWIFATMAAAAQLAGLYAGLTFGGWVVVALVAVVTGLPVALSLVGSRSDGALDNASGLVAVLLAAGEIPPAVPIGVLVTTAEELGLAGARAWAREHWVGGRAGDLPVGQVVLNCDGVDDVGSLIGMFTGRAPKRLLDALADAARTEGVRYTSRRLIPGILVDAVALADAGWEAVTLSRGTLATLARVHTRRDSLQHLRGDGIPEAAAVLSRAATELAMRRTG